LRQLRKTPEEREDSKLLDEFGGKTLFVSGILSCTCQVIVNLYTGSEFGTVRQYDVVKRIFGIALATLLHSGPTYGQSDLCPEDKISMIELEEPDSHALYLFQKGKLPLTEVSVSRDIGLLDDPISLIQMETERTVFRVDGTKPFCLFILHRGDPKESEASLKKGVFLNSHYELLSKNFAENVIFSNFGTIETTAITKSELERLLQGKQINRTKRRRIDNLMFEIESQKGAALEAVVDNTLFSKIFTIPIILDRPNFQHVF
jgi:hypothetical protein